MVGYWVVIKQGNIGSSISCTGKFISDKVGVPIMCKDFIVTIIAVLNKLVYY